MNPYGENYLYRGYDKVKNYRYKSYNTALTDEKSRTARQFRVLLNAGVFILWLD